MFWAVHHLLLYQMDQVCKKMKALTQAVRLVAFVHTNTANGPQLGNMWLLLF